MKRLSPTLHDSPIEALTAGAFGLRNGEIADAMSAHFTVDRSLFQSRPAWRLEQSAGPEVLPFAVHHLKLRQAVTYAQQVAGPMRCVVLLNGRHRVVRPARLMLGA